MSQTAPTLEAVATLTVMRGELERLPGLRENLSWCAERHLVETSEELAPEAHYRGFEVHHHPLHDGASFEAARAVALPEIKATWVLVIDTDERLPGSLVESLGHRLSDYVSAGIEGVWIPRQNHVLSFPLSYSSAWPDYQLRLLRRDVARFSDVLHDAMPHLTRTSRLPPDPAVAIQHHAFPSTAEFLEKTNKYTTIEAQQKVGSTAASPARALFAALREFAVRYFKMRGFRDGPAGLHSAVMMAVYRYLVVTKLWERQLSDRAERENLEERSPHVDP